MPHLEYHNGPVSPQELLKTIDPALDRYLTIETKPDGREYNSRTDANLLQALFRTRRSFSATLQSHLPDIDWQKESPLSPQEFHTFCERMSTFADPYCTQHWDRLSIQAQIARTTPQALAGQELLQDPDIRQPHMNVLHRFGDYLRTTHLHTEPTPEERQTEEQIEAYQALHAVVTDVVAALAEQDPRQSTMGKRLLHRILFLLDRAPPSSITTWVHGTQITLEEYECLTPSDTLRMIAASFQQTFPVQWQSDLSYEVAKVVRLGPSDTPMIRLLPIDHFYFQESIGQAPVPDTLPREGNCHHDPHTFHNASLFNHLGEKVFWGDLVDCEIRRIQGPYYVLSEQDSYHAIPEWAILPESDIPSHDPSRPNSIPDSAFPPDQRLLRINYLKMVALGKIENGQFVENPTAIPLDH